MYASLVLSVVTFGEIEVSLVSGGGVDFKPHPHLLLDDERIFLMFFA